MARLRPSPHLYKTKPFIGFVLTLLLSRLILRPSSLYTPTKSAISSPFAQLTPPIQNSIIVPAFHEQPNLRPLVSQVFAALRERRTTEIIIVDDNSQDGTVEEVERLKREGFRVELVVRTGKGEKGLSSAVLRGFERARGRKWLVMDADLQHPPSLIQPLFDALSASDVPIALGTRYGAGVSMSKDWPVYRRVISWGARMLAVPLTSVSDPMTGVFAIRKETFLASAPINPSGFKLALELLLKAPIAPGRAVSVPYSFGTRSVGASKLSSKTMLLYVGQLLSLYGWAWGWVFNLLLGVGAAVGVVLVERGLKRVKELHRSQAGGLGLPGMAPPKDKLTDRYNH